MTRRSFPRIDSAALRDHADDARVERVWDRIEHDLHSRVDRWGPNGFEAWSSRGRRSTLVYAAIAATFAAFGGGLLLGKATWDRKLTSEAPVVAAISSEKSTVEVLAAGTQLRTFPLAGGGQITLSPGATVEVERTGSALTLALLQGEAVIDTAARKAVAITAGEARLNTQAGSVLSVRRNQDDADVNVTSGTVSITSALGVTQELGKGDRIQVPIHAAVASAPIHAAPHRMAMLPRRPALPSAITPKGANVPEWLVRYGANDFDGALALLKKQDVNAMIESAKSARELMEIRDVMRMRGGDPASAIRALSRVVGSFPNDALAYAAAVNLASMNEDMGQHGKALEYRDLANKLAPNSGRAADALFCESLKDQMRTLGDKSKAAELAKEYLAKYPDGTCHEEFERMLQGDPAAPAADPAPPPPVP